MSVTVLLASVKLEQPPAGRRVGDMFKFGRSTRMYILGGPADLMPKEGLTKKQMLQMKALEASSAIYCLLTLA